ncbi:MAG: AMP-binding protein, partial [bacterium]|nr:AMP-binding protein [bacterium]
MISKSSSDRLAIAAEQNIKEREYWLEKLSGDLIKSSFPYDYKHGSQTSPAAGSATVTVSFPPELFEIVTKLSGGIDIKLHMILVTGLFVLLHKYCGNKDIIIGSPILKQEFDGEFINTVLVFRNEVDGNACFKDLLLQVRETIIDANEHQNYPMDILAEQLNVPVNAGKFPLADVVVLLEGIHDKQYLPGADYDILFVFGRRGGEIFLSLEYDKSLYRESTVNQIIHHCLHLLEQLPVDVNLPLDRVGLLSEEERKQVLIDFSDLETDYPRDKTLHRLFEEQVERTPDAIAVIGEDKENGSRVPITYGELNRRAGIIAGVLQEKGVAPDTIVAIMTNPSIEMFVGLLGILKAGGAYLPILPELPEERIEFMLKDSNAKILLKESEIRNPKSGTLRHGHPIKNSNIQNPKGPSGLAYVIYTSGTTGKPKGVMVEHGNVVAYLYSFFREFDITGEDTVIQLSAYSFDAFVEEMFPLLVRGGKIVIPDHSDIPDMESLARLITENGVTIVDCSPLLLNEFNKLTLKSTTSEANPLAGVRLFISGGDVLKAEYVNNLLNTGAVYNTYGPTETTVCAAYYKCGVPLPADVPIGKPIAN